MDSGIRVWGTTAEPFMRGLRAVRQVCCSGPVKGLYEGCRQSGKTCKGALLTKPPDSTYKVIGT